MEPATYVRPHRHPEAGKWELFTVLRGSLVALTFDDEGRVTSTVDRLLEEVAEYAPAFV